MTRRLAVLLLAATPVFGASASAGEDGRLVFYGDAMLSREVAREVALRRGASPWSGLAAVTKPGEFAMANFEGAVGAAEGCRDAGAAPCFAVAPEMLRFLAEAGFGAVGLANNHAGDLGAEGRAHTRQALREVGVQPLDFDDSPGFVRIGRRTVAIVAIDLVKGRDGRSDPLPSLIVERKLRLGRALADWVVAFVHWGAELRDWPQEDQRRQADWLVGHGADVVIGHHPHVPITPECLRGHPVFYSLGNHVFDQKYPDTKRGMAADCRILGDRLSCRPLRTATPVNSAFPRPAPAAAGDEAVASCTVAAGTPLEIAGQRLRPWGEPARLMTGPVVLEGETGGKTAWRAAGRALLSVEAGVLQPGKPPMLVTVERHPSPLDGEDGPRPYVYDVRDRGLIARWRGSALAWPLIDARLMEADGMSLLCALHRADSFIRLDPAAAGTRTAVYRWSGFGFAAVTDAAAADLCRKAYAEAGRMDWGNAPAEGRK